MGSGGGIQRVIAGEIAHGDSMRSEASEASHVPSGVCYLSPVNTEIMRPCDPFRLERTSSAALYRYAYRLVSMTGEAQTLQWRRLPDLDLPAENRVHGSRAAEENKRANGKGGEGLNKRGDMLRLMVIV
ncbi:uncharacterized protein FPRO_04127 [Fusarium proliferatum ET1]|uniref:Uncharacterized protein n=1 Tax=Fusarium proliferatum (strain ET1) TaxID=1227346 RepID=A0A1L7W7K6_FUSPR|nr:uncharacterized protein FPRO_04127 [Fusarium proliferatum ET1]CZR48547.1 uncharacterized protein FPRO_04127 [Fusarium proliferatum ET1]